MDRFLRSTRWRRCSLWFGSRCGLRGCGIPLSITFSVCRQDYRKRFLELPVHAGRTLDLGVAAFKFATPSRAETERRAVESLAKLSLTQDDLATTTTTTTACPSPSSVRNPTTPSTPQAPSPTVVVPLFPPLPSLPISTLPDHATTTTTGSQALPSGAESMKALATFLRPGAPKELPLDEMVRNTVVRNLAFGCHPDVVSRK